MEQNRGLTSGESLVAQLEDVLQRLCHPSVEWPVDAHAQLDVIDRIRRSEARLRSHSAVLIADADRRKVADRAVGTSMTSWLTSQHNATSREAARQVLAGRELNARPTVRSAALAGDVSPEQARKITSVLDSLPATLSAEQQERATDIMVSLARTTNADRLGTMAQAVLDAVAPEDDERSAAEREVARLDLQRRRAYRNRSFTFHTEDGSLLFRGSLPLLEGEALVRLLESYRASEHTSGADRLDPLAPVVTSAHRYADALIRLVGEHQRARVAPAVSGDRPRVVVVMREEALRGLAEQSGLLGRGDRVAPGDLRRLCCDADLVPAVLGSSSEVLDVGREVRLVTPAIRKALALRDLGCAFPGCDKPDEQCEAHHITPWWREGRTALDNLVLLCGHHHALVEPERFFPVESGPPTGRPVAADRWEVRLNERGLPEFLPPSRLDPTRTARSKGARLGTSAA